MNITYIIISIKIHSIRDNNIITQSFTQITAKHFPLMAGIVDKWTT